MSASSTASGASASIDAIDFHGLEALRLSLAGGESAVISRHGAQLLSWRTAGGRERLYLSDRAVFDGQAPIRGGVPVCFPQFADEGDLPRHGLVRTRPWQVEAQRCGDGYALTTLVIADDAATRALWPHAFRLELTLQLEPGRIDLELCVANPGEEPFDFAAALHSYLRVVEVEDVTLEGLRGCIWRDRSSGREARETGIGISVEDGAAFDRIYRDARRPLLLQAGNLSLGIAAQGFPDVVVWNPGAAAVLPDLPPDGWRRMLCVEAALAAAPLTLAGGAEWCGRQTLVAV